MNSSITVNARPVRLPGPAGRLCIFLRPGLFSAFLACLLITQPVSAQNTTELSAEGLPAGELPAIQGPVVLSHAVRRSLFDHPAMQAGRARTCQTLYRLGTSRAETRPQVSGSVTSQRQLFSHFKTSNNTDRDSAETRAVSERELNVYDLEVTLSQKLWDWHVSDNRIRSDELAHQVERLQQDLTLSEQLL